MLLVVLQLADLRWQPLINECTSMWSCAVRASVASLSLPANENVSSIKNPSSILFFQISRLY